MVSFTSGFHGRTMGALALTYKDQYKTPFSPNMPGCHIIPYLDSKAAVRTIQKVTLHAANATHAHRHLALALESICSLRKHTPKSSMRPRCVLHRYPLQPWPGVMQSCRKLSSSSAASLQIIVACTCQLQAMSAEVRC